MQYHSDGLLRACWWKHSRWNIHLMMHFLRCTTGSLYYRPFCNTMCSCRNILGYIGFCFFCGYMWMYTCTWYVCLLYLLSAVLNFFYLSNHKLNAVHWLMLHNIMMLDVKCLCIQELWKVLQSDVLYVFKRHMHNMNRLITEWAWPLLAFRGQQRSVGLQLLRNVYFHKTVS